MCRGAAATQHVNTQEHREQITALRQHSLCNGQAALSLSGMSTISCHSFPPRKHLWGAVLMDILQLALDTRKVILVDVALGLIQRLVAHQHLVGTVTAVRHRRDQTGRKKGEEEDEVEGGAEQAALPQARPFNRCTCAGWWSVGEGQNSCLSAPAGTGAEDGHSCADAVLSGHGAWVTGTSR